MSGKCIEREYRGKIVGFITNPSLDTLTAQQHIEQKKLHAIKCDKITNVDN